jgi:structural maintenance of chromosome 1
MDDIRLPMVKGTMDDISQEGGGGAASQDSEVDSMSTQGQKAIYEREANIQIDYESLDEEMKEVSR